MATTIDKYSYIGCWKFGMKINNKKMMKTYAFISINNDNLQITFCHW